ncbi:MAG TPA: DEAD/DEAH box helicase [Candidatus Binataceae bacterium]|nr:DEAD/DEAH box helicase [Candidatus Binataceae bacterium]
MSFSTFALIPEVLRAVRERGYDEATAIQAEAIPEIMAGRDVMATAQTGSGKTAAFLLPIIDRLQRERANRLSVIILAPTRELAAQIGREFELLARHTLLSAAVVVGGESMDRQLQKLRKGAQVLVGCPGRLIDHIERGTVKLDHIKIAVIDEADRLLDMGFMPQLRRIMQRVPHQRQTLMFSATMASAVQRIAREFLTDPARVETQVTEISTPPETIRQVVCPVATGNKGQMLLEILRRPVVTSAIVFTRTRNCADRVGRLLVRHGVKAIVIHGERTQGQRNEALAGFRAGAYRILVATDVAARGLDIPDVSHVINYDLPEEPEGYVHRIGRTARMGKSGQAVSLVTPEERALLGQIERALKITLERENVEGFEALEIIAPKPVKVFSSSRMRNRPSRMRSPAF